MKEILKAGKTLEGDMIKLLLLIPFLALDAVYALDIERGYYGTLSKASCGYKLELSGKTVSLVSKNNPTNGLLCKNRVTKNFLCNEQAYCVNTLNEKEGLSIVSNKQFYLGGINNDQMELKTLYSISDNMNEVEASLFREEAIISVRSLPDYFPNKATCKEAVESIAFRRAFKSCKEAGFSNCEDVETSLTSSSGRSSADIMICRAESYFKGL